MTIAKVTVLLKDQILDPQGKAVLKGLHALGFKNVKDVRQGKVFTITLETSGNSKELRAMADQLLANPVMENFTIDIVGQ